MKELRVSGFTLLELLMVIAIIAILGALAVPSFNTTVEKRRIVEAAEAVLADLRWARAEAIKRNKKVRVVFTTGSSWSYRVTVDPYNSADDLKTVNGSSFPSTNSLTANFGSVAYTTFEPVRGTGSAGNATIASDNFSATVTVSTLGRMKICDMEGYDAC
jgi:type IV fimbrial biogenesis protein FimT